MKGLGISIYPLNNNLYKIKGDGSTITIEKSVFSNEQPIFLSYLPVISYINGFFQVGVKGHVTPYYHAIDGEISPMFYSGKSVGVVPRGGKVKKSIYSVTLKPDSKEYYYKNTVTDEDDIVFSGTILHDNTSRLLLYTTATSHLKQEMIDIKFPGQFGVPETLFDINHSISQINVVFIWPGGKGFPSAPTTEINITVEMYEIGKSVPHDPNNIMFNTAIDATVDEFVIEHTLMSSKAGSYLDFENVNIYASAITRTYVSDTIGSVGMYQNPIQCDIFCYPTDIQLVSHNIHVKVLDAHILSLPYLGAPVYIFKNVENVPDYIPTYEDMNIFEYEMFFTKFGHTYIKYDIPFELTKVWTLNLSTGKKLALEIDGISKSILFPPGMLNGPYIIYLTLQYSNAFQGPLTVIVSSGKSTKNIALSYTNLLENDDITMSKSQIGASSLVLDYDVILYARIRPEKLVDIIDIRKIGNTEEIGTMQNIPYDYEIMPDNIIKHFNISATHTDYFSKLQYPLERYYDKLADYMLENKYHVNNLSFMNTYLLDHGVSATIEYELYRGNVIATIKITSVNDFPVYIKNNNEYFDSAFYYGYESYGDFLIDPSKEQPFDNDNRMIVTNSKTIRLILSLISVDTKENLDYVTNLKDIWVFSFDIGLTDNRYDYLGKPITATKRFEFKGFGVPEFGFGPFGISQEALDGLNPSSPIIHNIKIDPEDNIIDSVTTKPKPKPKPKSKKKINKKDVNK